MAVEFIAPKIGCSAQTLLIWVERNEVESGQRERPTTGELERIKELEREVRSCVAPTIFCARLSLFPSGGARPQTEVVIP
jgi:transposase-like protein